MSSNPISCEATAPPSPNPVKKRRNLPGNPDPDAEVIALSPKSLMATNRFMCEICNKGFQRDQNLQLHRRGHNLPWKLKQKASKELIRKKVYICPEVSCVHHHPSRALGDLTGIKKHFSRKHGEKKYKCDKCSKKYAVQSDWKAHSKTCGTREYRCDCGTIFSRRDSFITHRAFCAALAEESAKSIREATNPNINIPHNNINTTINSPQYPLLFSTAEINQQPPSPLPSINADVHHDDEISLKRENHQQHFNMRAAETQQPMWADDQFSCHDQTFSLHHFPLPPSAYHQTTATTTPPHLSATALLQKAAEMGATMSRPAHTTSVASTTTTTTIHSPLLQEMLMISSSHQGLNEGMTTRDFLGLKALSHKEIFSMAAAGLELDSHCTRPSFEESQQQNKRYMN